MWKTAVPSTGDEPTKEHFIPRSIGGSWTITVCKTCNKTVDHTCDRMMKQVGYVYEIFRRGMVIRDGIAELTTGKELPVVFKYQTTAEGHHQFFWCREKHHDIRVPRDLIRRVYLPVMEKREVIGTLAAVLKIAVGATYFLLRFNRHWTNNDKVREAFEGLAFADLRSRLLTTRFRPGGRGRGHGAIVVTLTAAEATAWLEKCEVPSVRQHIISIEDSGAGVNVSICLFSVFFWRVTIPDIELGIGACECRKPLPHLQPVDPQRATALMYNEGRHVLSIVVNE